MKSQHCKSGVAGLPEGQCLPAQQAPSSLPRQNSAGAGSSVEAGSLCLTQRQSAINSFQTPEKLWDLVSLKVRFGLFKRQWLLCSLFSTIWNSDRTRSNWISPKFTNWQFYAVLLPLCSWKSPHWCREEVRPCFGLSSTLFGSGTISLVILSSVCF